MHPEKFIWRVKFSFDDRQSSVYVDLGWKSAAVDAVQHAFKNGVTTGTDTNFTMIPPHRIVDASITKIVAPDATKSFIVRVKAEQ